MNSLLSVSRMSQNNDKQMIIDTNPLNQVETKSSAKAYMKFQSNFNIINDMFNNMKTDTNNNESLMSDKNQDMPLALPESPLKNLEEPKKPEEKEKEKVNDVFINLLRDQKDPLDFSGTFNSNMSFFLHEPKSSAVVQKPRRNDSGTSFMMLTKGNQDNSFDEGFFDSLNTMKRGKPPSGTDIVKKWDTGAEDDELASILG